MKCSLKEHVEFVFFVMEENNILILVCFMLKMSLVHGDYYTPSEEVGKQFQLVFQQQRYRESIENRHPNQIQKVCI